MDITKQYTELEIIKQNDNKKISLVRSKIDNLLYLKKEILIDNKNIYYQLNEIDSDYFPKIYQIQEKTKQIIIIEEYINAPTLEEVLLNEVISKETAKKIFIQVCLAVQTLHQLQPIVIHRDIKPANIFYDRGKIKLFDFDISRNYNDEKNKDTQLLGSVGYAAPEQYGFGQSSQQSDIYALGILLNMLLTKELPGDLMYSGNEAKVIKKAISLDPQNRYQTVGELLADLEVEQDIKKLKISFLDLPGFRSGSKTKKIFALLGYIMIIALCFDTAITINNVKVRGLMALPYQLCILLVFLTVILIGGNYCQIQRKCFFAKNKFKLIRFVGIIIYIIVVLFLEILLFSMVIAIVQLL